MSEFITNMTVVTEVSLIVSQIQGEQVISDPCILFENYTKCPIRTFQFWCFPLIYLLKLTHLIVRDCFFSRFQNHRPW